ncbi:MAG: branched-chain amino acid ABC transporter permease [Thermoleophilia bacterium]
MSDPAPTTPAFRVARSEPLHRYVLFVSVAVVAVLASVPFWAQTGTMRTLVTFFTLLALAQMWNLLGGYAGLISVGQQAYVGVGAYGLWLFGDVLHVHPFVSVPLAGVLAAAIALPVGPLIFRLKGGYFAIGTWVVAEVVRLIVANIQATGGGSGTTIISAARLPMDTRIPGTYYLALGVAVGSILAVYFLLRSRVGLALTAIRDNDLAAQSSGVNVFRSKLVVYVVAAFGCGVMGSVVAMNLLRIQPTAAFSINWTAYAIFIVVIGGFATIEGALLGSVIYFVLLQTLSQYGTTYMLLLGVIAVIMATKAPRGLWGFVAKRWNLHLFPVRRRLVMERPAAAAPAENAAAGDTSAEPA